LGPFLSRRRSPLNANDPAKRPQTVTVGDEPNDGVYWACTTHTVGQKCTG
jgi:hypothetical protein